MTRTSMCSVTLALGAARLAKEGAIVARMSAVEEMAGMSILCSDKTGALPGLKLQACSSPPSELGCLSAGLSCCGHRAACPLGPCQLPCMRPARHLTDTAAWLQARSRSTTCLWTTPPCSTWTPTARRMS